MHPEDPDRRDEFPAAGAAEAAALPLGRAPAATPPQGAAAVLAQAAGILRAVGRDPVGVVRRAAAPGSVEATAGVAGALAVLVAVCAGIGIPNLLAGLLQSAAGSLFGALGAMGSGLVQPTGHQRMQAAVVALCGVMGAWGAVSAIRVAQRAAGSGPGDLLATAIAVLPHAAVVLIAGILGIHGMMVLGGLFSAAACVTAVLFYEHLLNGARVPGRWALFGVPLILFGAAAGFRVGVAVAF